MKNKFAEAVFSFLALYLFSCFIAAAIVMGILLVPVAFAALFVLVLKDLIFSKKKTSKPNQTSAVNVKGKVITISSWIPRNRKAA